MILEGDYSDVDVSDDETIPSPPPDFESVQPEGSHQSASDQVADTASYLHPRTSLESQRIVTDPTQHPNSPKGKQPSFGFQSPQASRSSSMVDSPRNWFQSGPQGSQMDFDIHSPQSFGSPGNQVESGPQGSQKEFDFHSPQAFGSPGNQVESGPQGSQKEFDFHSPQAFGSPGNPNPFRSGPQGSQLEFDLHSAHGSQSTFETPNRKRPNFGFQAAERHQTNFPLLSPSPHCGSASFNPPLSSWMTPPQVGTGIQVHIRTCTYIVLGLLLLPRVGVV